MWGLGPQARLTIGGMAPKAPWRQSYAGTRHIDLQQSQVNSASLTLTCCDMGDEAGARVGWHRSRVQLGWLIRGVLSTAAFMPILTEEDVAALLRAEVRKCKNMSAWAKGVSLDRTHVSSVVHQKRPISKSIIRALGLRTAVVDDAARVLTKSEILKLLRANVVAVGGQSAWARKNQMDRALLNKALRKRRPLPTTMIRALGLHFVVISE